MPGRHFNCTKTCNCILPILGWQVGFALTLLCCSTYEPDFLYHPQRKDTKNYRVAIIIFLLSVCSGRVLEQSNCRVAILISPTYSNNNAFDLIYPSWICKFTHLRLSDYDFFEAVISLHLFLMSAALLPSSEHKSIEIASDTSFHSGEYLNLMLKWFTFHNLWTMS